MLIELWIPIKAQAWIQRWFRPEHVGFEFGSGGSTLWLGQRVRSLISVEHKQLWFDRVSSRIKKLQLTNVNLLYQPNLQLYPKTILTYPERCFDFIFVDGRRRVRCVEYSRPHVKPGGLLILDNSERPRYREAFKLLKGWPRHDFKGEGPQAGSGPNIPQIWQTSIWTRPRN